MAAQQYGLGDLNFNGQRIKTVTGNETFQMKVWGGSVRVNITKEKEFKPIFERSLSPDKLTIVKRQIHQVMKASPGSKFPIVFSTWDREQKKSVIDYVLTFIKDDKNMYHIEMQWKGNKFDTLLKGPFGVSLGGPDGISDADKSAIELETLLDWITSVAPIQCILTNRRREFDANQNGNTYTVNKGASKESSNPDDEFFS